ncbi:MAG: hypothetical protein PWQ57_2065 [Desulfovibrionales bacterium]|jgi:uncharacterized protein (TIGR02058 family)|nr:hypothetical protein [Desulfovibrionales bacterium]
MAKKRFAIELGYGADLHGENMTTAAVRAVRDAVSHACLCGILEICGLSDLDRVHVHAEAAVPDPESVDRDAVLSAIPLGQKTLKVVKGGLIVEGVEVPRFAPGVDHIVMACAALTVSIETDAASDSSAPGKQACGCSAGDN